MESLPQPICSKLIYSGKMQVTGCFQICILPYYIGLVDEKQYVKSVLCPNLPFLKTLGKIFADDLGCLIMTSNHKVLV